MIAVKGVYRVVALSDLILPPISSKVMKYIIERYGASVLRDLTLSRRAFKPLQISPLMQGGRFLISSGKPLQPVVRGSVLTSTISTVINDETYDITLMEVSGVFDTPYGRVAVEPTEIMVEDLTQVRDLGKFFKIEFLTPTVLTAKYMVPPPLKVKSRGLPERHRLLPQPSFIFSYLLRFWNSIAGPTERIPSPAAGDWEAYKLGRLADVTLVEVDYDLRAETAIIGRDSKGRLRRVRGFTGWVIYECLSRKLLPIYSKLLALANYLGIGRSRGIGLGVVRVKPQPTIHP